MSSHQPLQSTPGSREPQQALPHEAHRGTQVPCLDDLPDVLTIDQDLWRVEKLPLDVLRLWVTKMYRALGMPEPADVLIETGRALKQGRLSLLGAVARPPPGVKAQPPNKKRASAAATARGSARRRNA